MSWKNLPYQLKGFIIGGIIGFILSITIGSIDQPFWMDYIFSKNLYSLIAPIFLVTLIGAILGLILISIKTRYGRIALIIASLITFVVLIVFMSLEPLDGQNIYNKPVSRYICNHFHGNLFDLRDCEENSLNVGYFMVNRKPCFDDKGNSVPTGTTIGAYQWWSGKIEGYYHTGYEKGTCKDVEMKAYPNTNSKCQCSTSF